MFRLYTTDQGLNINFLGHKPLLVPTVSSYIGFGKYSDPLTFFFAHFIVL